MSFPKVFESEFAELNMMPTKSEMETVGLGTSREERNQYRWTGKTYENVDNIDYERFINPKTNRPFRFTETANTIKDVGTSITNQVKNIGNFKPVQFFLNQTGLASTERLFKKGSTSALNFANQRTPDNVKNVISSATQTYDKAIIGLSQQLDVNPLLTETGLTAIETLGPGAVKNIAKKKLVSNLNDLTKLVPSSRQVAVAGNGSEALVNQIPPTVFKTNSVTEQALGYKRKAFNVSNKSIPEIKNKFIKDLTEISGIDTATVTKKYDEILTSGRIKKPRNFAGNSDQYKQVKAYFQSIQDLGIEKKKSLYTVINTADGPKKYFPDFKGGTANRAAVISLDAKLARVKITNKKRWQRILNQTLNKEDIGNWHTKMAKELGDEAHHLNELHLIGVMTDGRSIDSQLSVIKQLNDKLIFTGNSTFNKFNLPVKVHDRVHNEMRKVFAEYKNIDFTKMSNDQLVNFFKTDYKPKIQQIQETIFSEMQLYRKAK
tara:strand:+ start:50 stop:1522 length:1473 start_codon:yes stop_codon:yes gene_type:complete